MYKIFIYNRFLIEILELKNFCDLLKLKGVTTHSKIKLYESIKRCMFEIANDPGSRDYFLGNTMGAEHKDWRRSKKFLPDRHRLFFKYFSRELEIYYAWLNDENTLRKAGSKTDCYKVFQSFLDNGTIPSERENLQKDSTPTDLSKL